MDNPQEIYRYICLALGGVNPRVKPPGGFSHDYVKAFPPPRSSSSRQEGVNEEGVTWYALIVSLEAIRETL